MSDKYESLYDPPTCLGQPDSRCNYKAHCGSVCNKCGNIHNGNTNLKSGAYLSWNDFNVYGSVESINEVKRMTDTCDCRQCLRDRNEGQWFWGRFVPMEMLRMIVCAKCGNKRCPHATDHRNACTSSNEPGQPGSVYGKVKHD